jgi:CheY-like chemotaxis protein
MTFRVFVVDDEKTIASTTTTILQLSGYEARSFANSLEALETAQIDCPDLVLSDVMMSELTGIDLAFRLKEICPVCKIILFSGQTKTTTDLLEAARREGHEFTVLAKPIYPTELLARIKEEMEG